MGEFHFPLFKQGRALPGGRLKHERPSTSGLLLLSLTIPRVQSRENVGSFFLLTSFPTLLLHCSFPQLRSVRFSPEPSSGNHPKTFPLARPMLSQSVPKGGKTLNVSTFSIIPAKGKAGFADPGGPGLAIEGYCEEVAGAVARRW